MTLLSFWPVTLEALKFHGPMGVLIYSSTVWYAPGWFLFCQLLILSYAYVKRNRNWLPWMERHHPNWKSGLAV